jgi:glycosyltransferase involved in cell wall biosynthesis
MKTRVLHVVTAMSRGGLEVWLMSVLRNIDRDRYQLDFLVQTADRAMFDDEIAALGSKVIRCARGANIFTFSAAFLGALRREGPYDIVHTHVHHFSGIVALLCRIGGIRSVIAHSHSVAYANRQELSLPRRAYLRLTELMIRWFSDVGLGCSAPAYGDLFPDWQKQGRQNVLLCGIDLEPYARAMQAAHVERPEARARKTLVHVGRFNKPKNHRFLLDVLAELAKRRDDFNVLLVGSGPLRPASEAYAAQLGLTDRIVFTGDRSDVPSLLVHSDLFFFPSLFEGLGLALVEAQAAGLGCVISENIPDEATVVTGLVHRERLDAGAHAWAEVADQVLNGARPDREACLQQVRGVFDIRTCVVKLCALYDDLVTRHSPGRQ